MDRNDPYLMEHLTGLPLDTYHLQTRDQKDAWHLFEVILIDINIGMLESVKIVHDMHGERTLPG